MPRLLHFSSGLPYIQARTAVGRWQSLHLKLNKAPSAMTVVLARLLPYVAALLMSTSIAGTACAAGVPEPEQLAPDVYAVMGATAPAAPGNRGVVGNLGILVGPEGVILIDTGTSARQARQVLAD